MSRRYQLVPLSCHLPSLLRMQLAKTNFDFVTTAVFSALENQNASDQQKLFAGKSHDAVGDLIFQKYGTLWNKDSFWDPISNVKHLIHFDVGCHFACSWIAAHLQHCDNVQQSKICWGCSSSASCVKSWSNESLEVWWCLEHLQRIWQGRRQTGSVLDSGGIRYAATVYLSCYHCTYHNYIMLKNAIYIYITWIKHLKPNDFHSSCSSWAAEPPEAAACITGLSLSRRPLRTSAYAPWFGTGTWRGTLWILSGFFSNPPICIIYYIIIYTYIMCKHTQYILV